MRKMLKFCRPHIGLLILAAISSMGCSLVNVWVIDIFKNLIDMSMNGGIDNLTAIMMQGALALVFGVICNYLVIHTTEYFGTNVLKDMRKEAMTSLSRMSLEHVENANFGDLISRMTSDIEGVAYFMEGYLKDLIYVPVLIFVFLVYLFSMDWILALASLITLVFLVPLSVKMMDPVKRAQSQYVQKLANTNNNIQEVCDGIVAVKSYNLEETMNKKYYDDLHVTLDISNRNDLLQYNAEPIPQLIANLPVVIALCLGGWFVFEGNITMGVLVAFVSLVRKLLEPLGSVYAIIVKGKLTMINVQRTLEIFETPEEMNIHVKSKPDRNTKNVFELKGVGFSYRGVAPKSVLRDIDLVIREGEKTAFVGVSGCGKSTLLKMLYKHYEAETGSIKYRGIDYREINPKMLRSDVSLISQDVFLFPMSIYDNIRVGKINATKEEVIRASQLANCYEFISELPDGFDTYAGERGSHLSGGQKQRISIARAILKDAPVILLDEPTSALDKESEMLVNEAIDRITVNRTVVVVAHRMTTVTISDKIVVMEGGQIVEVGTHDYLMKLNGTYSQLYKEYISDSEVAKIPTMLCANSMEGENKNE